MSFKTVKLYSLVLLFSMILVSSACFDDASDNSASPAAMNEEYIQKSPGDGILENVDTRQEILNAINALPSGLGYYFRTNFTSSARLYDYYTNDKTQALAAVNNATDGQLVNWDLIYICYNYYSGATTPLYVYHFDWGGWVDSTYTAYPDSDSNIDVLGFYANWYGYASVSTEEVCYPYITTTGIGTKVLLYTKTITSDASYPQYSDTPHSLGVYVQLLYKWHTASI